jgi:hypothetical protein
MELFTLEQIKEFSHPIEADEDLKNEFINLESTLSISCVYLAVKWLINQNKESTYYSDYTNNQGSESVFKYKSRQITVGEELLLTDSIGYLTKQKSSIGNIRYEIADAFVHATGDNGHEHFINLLKKRISQMVSNNNKMNNSEADNLFERISEIFNSDEYCFHMDEVDMICFDCALEIKNKVDSMLLKDGELETNLTSVTSLFKRSFEQVRYNPDSKIAQRIYSTEDLVGMIFIMCKIFQNRFKVADFYKIIRELVGIWDNQQPILYDGINEEDMDTFQFAIGMYEENELYEYSILDSEISTFLNSLQMEQIYSVLGIMGHPRFKTNRQLAQRIKKSEEYARQIKQSTEEELKKFFENYDEADSEDQEYAVRVISNKCKEMARIYE